MVRLLPLIGQNKNPGLSRGSHAWYDLGASLVSSAENTRPQPAATAAVAAADVPAGDPFHLNESSECKPHSYYQNTILCQ
jgi:hypothetical protein